jgi:hypothetical protein
MKSRQAPLNVVLKLVNNSHHNFVLKYFKPQYLHNSTASYIFLDYTTQIFNA